MSRLLVAGILYLIVIAILLTIKPSFMFSEDGTWKEFGIGRNPNTHTWMPFWLFAVLWALVSYILATVGLALWGGEAASPAPAAHPQPQRRQKVIDEVVEMEAADFEVPAPVPRRRGRGVPMDLPDGYYVLNTKATAAAGGIPKYVYIGQGLD